MSFEHNMHSRFAGFWTMYFPVATFVSYLFFFGIGGYLHVSTACQVFIFEHRNILQFTYYVGKRDSPEEWKCQPNKWLSSREEIHEILVGWFSVTLGSALSAALASWVVNGGQTTLYYDFGEI